MAASLRKSFFTDLGKFLGILALGSVGYARGQHHDR